MPDDEMTTQTGVPSEVPDVLATAVVVSSSEKLLPNNSLPRMGDTTDDYQGNRIPVARESNFADGSLSRQRRRLDRLFEVDSASYHSTGSDVTICDTAARACSAVRAANTTARTSLPFVGSVNHLCNMSVRVPDTPESFETKRRKLLSMPFLNLGMPPD